MKKADIPEIAQEKYFRVGATLANIPIREEDGLTWIDGQQPGYPRTILETCIKNKDIQHCIANAMEKIRDGILPDMWSETPTTKPKRLDLHLSRNGFIVAWSATCMVLELKKLPPQPDRSPGYRFMTLTDGTLIEEWAGIVTRELFKKDAEHAAGFAAYLRKIWHDRRIQLFAATKDDTLVGTALLCMNDELAWIGYVSVAKDHRRRGLGAQLAWQAAARAKDRGMHTVALHASDLGEPVYTRLGFKPVSHIKRRRLIAE
jgi:GNAT superfamily N-acetyltransferase